MFFLLVRRPVNFDDGTLEASPITKHESELLLTSLLKLSALGTLQIA